MEYKTKSHKYYSNLRPEMQALLPKTARRVLDVGCGAGAMAYQLKERYKLEVWGIEFYEAEALEAQKVLDKAYIGGIEENLEYLPDDYFDAIYLNDVLEHLANPNQVLDGLKSKLNVEGVIISSIPNARYHKVMRQYIFGKDWKYTKAGIMDFTHLRFFTSLSIKRMYKELGYEIQLHKGINKTSSLMPYLLNIPLLGTGGDLFYTQFATVASKAKS
ncbi:class I SAM-dependent methyltransferase [Nonlabens ponticola]|uniref:Class I SAM-dependent methyltransferase n=1 Tax=Nonlabens ponticola TaxID=2496866 RepID=A0A3S9MZF2_9FLAO|nr:class I SAM-dependent methyltransferase [Nonlabens ponticola]AZQ44443.1 class I SAM-dependent methyltransferase [Nonlabens ponticola]